MLLRRLDPFVGELMLRQVHMGSLQRFIAKRQSDGVKTRSINNALALVRHILNLAASEWRDEQGLTWLEYAPKIKLLKVRDGARPTLCRGMNRQSSSRNCRITSRGWPYSRPTPDAVNRRFAAFGGITRSRCPNSTVRCSSFRATR
jgi:hypothetical protein